MDIGIRIIMMYNNLKKEIMNNSKKHNYIRDNLIIDLLKKILEIERVHRWKI